MFLWDDTTISLLSDMWRQGLTGSEIGHRIGCSRNAAIGKANRLNLSPRQAREKVAKRKVPLYKNPAPKKPVVAKSTPAVVIPAAPHLPVALEDLERHHCRWINDDRTYCGNQKERGSYCSGHAAITYVSDEPKVRRMFVGRPSVNTF